MRTRNTILSILLALAVLLSLAACGGNGMSGSDGAGTTPGGSAEPQSIPMTDPGLTTYDVGGFYTVAVPKDIEAKKASFSDAISVNSSDGTWFMRFNSKEGGVAEYDAQKQLNRDKDTFTPITVGEQEGFWIYEDMRGEVFIYFPFGLVQLGDELQSSAEKRAAYLDDPVVQELLASVKLSDKANVTAEPFDAVAWRELFDAEIKAQNGKYQMSDEPTEEDGNLVYGLRFEDAPYGGGSVTIYQDGTGAAEYSIGFFALEDSVTSDYASLALWCAGVNGTPLTVAIDSLHIYYFDLPEGETGTYERDGLKITSQWGKYGFVIRFEPT